MQSVQGNSSYGGVKSILPIKLIAAGVIPVIFAVASSLPAFVGQVLKATNNPAYFELANNLIAWFQACSQVRLQALNQRICLSNCLLCAGYSVHILLYRYRVQFKRDC